MTMEPLPQQRTLLRIEEVDDSPADGATLPINAGALEPAPAPQQHRHVAPFCAAPSSPSIAPEQSERAHLRIEEVDGPEPAAAPANGPTRAMSAPITIEEVNDSSPITAAELAPPPPPSPTPAGGWAVPAILAISLIILLILAAVDWVVGLVAHHSILAIPAAIGLACFLGAAAVVVWRELRSLRRLRDAEELRALLLAPSEVKGQRQRLSEGIGRWVGTLEESHRKSAQMFLGSVAQEPSILRIARSLEAEVLFRSDDRALDAVHRAAYDIFFLVAISPTALTDTAVFAARATRMLTDVAGCYGTRPGRLARLRIARRALADVALVSAATIAAGAAAKGAGDLLKDVGTNISRAASVAAEPHLSAAGFAIGAAVSTGGAMMNKAGGEIAGAITASIRIAQLGMLVMNTTRPLPFDSERQVLLASELRKRIMSFQRQSPRAAVTA